MFPDPGDRQPAPQPLRLVQQFVNTRDIENGGDELSAPAELARVLRRIGVTEKPLSGLGDGHLQAAVQLREALRELLLANNRGRLGRRALDVLGRSAGAGQLSIQFHEDGGATLVPQATGLDGALGRIVAVAFTAMADGSWQRLKACRRDICRWVFYDRSKNRSSTWCAMSVCGNRTKIRRYRGLDSPGVLQSTP
ncbi:MAG: CGNR zinc finger domain-containing protein [Actinobacteria bacterium]|nr:CGNR zinc finger domain-containing protein [Actinomycetota bacterium]